MEQDYKFIITPDSPTTFPRSSPEFLGDVQNSTGGSLGKGNTTAYPHEGSLQRINKPFGSEGAINRYKLLVIYLFTYCCTCFHSRPCLHPAKLIHSLKWGSRCKLLLRVKVDTLWVPIEMWILRNIQSLHTTVLWIEWPFHLHFLCRKPTEVWFVPTWEICM